MRPRQHTSTSPLDGCPVCGAELHDRAEPDGGSNLRSGADVRCGTDLADPAPPKTCPGCGFAYDVSTRIWRSEESWGRLALVYIAWGLLAGLFISVLQGIGLAEAPHPVLPLVLGVAAAFAGLALRRLLSGRITGRFVALTAAGIVVGTRPVRQTRPAAAREGALSDAEEDGLQCVPWANFDRLVEERGVLKIRTRSGPAAVIPIPLDDIFNSRQEAADFRATVLAAARAQRRPG